MFAIITGSKVKVLFAAFALLFSVQAASAQQKASIVIVNPTDTPLIYEMNWGTGGEWKRFTVPPGKENSHWIDIRGSERIPNVPVRFDWICGDGAVTYKDYTLDYYTVTEPFAGRRYFFRYDVTGTRLDLYFDR